MIQCLEEVIFEIASTQKFDRGYHEIRKIGGANVDVDEVVTNARKRMEELKHDLEQKINPCHDANGG